MTSDNYVYRTRIVSRDFQRADRAINHFSDPDEAKQYLEAYIEEALDAVPTEWRREESADQKWSMGIAPKQGYRAVVMGCPVYDSADEPLSKMRDTLGVMADGE